MKKFTLLLTSCFFFNHHAKSQSACVSNLNNIYSFTIGATKFELVKEAKTWKEALNCAISRGGKLAEIDSEQKQKDILKNVSLAGIKLDLTRAKDGDNAAYIWMGATDASEEGKWLWDGEYNNIGLHFWSGDASGIAVNNNYTNWAAAQPNDYQLQQDCLGFALENWTGGSGGMLGQWNDLNGNHQLYYLIEYSKPVTSILYNMDNNTIQIECLQHLSLLKINHSQAASFRCFLYNPLGEIVIESSNQSEIPLNNISPGLYIFTVICENKTSVYRLLKE